jgi:hypothetical protein
VRFAQDDLPSIVAPGRVCPASGRRRGTSTGTIADAILRTTTGCNVGRSWKPMLAINEGVPRWLVSLVLTLD